MISVSTSLLHMFFLRHNAWTYKFYTAMEKFVYKKSINQVEPSLQVHICYSSLFQYTHSFSLCTTLGIWPAFK